jgi:hypothetical protein
MTQQHLWRFWITILQFRVANDQPHNILAQVHFWIQIRDGIENNPYRHHTEMKEHDG